MARRFDRYLRPWGNSDVPEVEDKLRAWRHSYEIRNGVGDTISHIAQESADRIRSKSKGCG